MPLIGLPPFLCFVQGSLCSTKLDNVCCSAHFVFVMSFRARSCALLSSCVILHHKFASIFIKTARKWNCYSSEWLEMFIDYNNTILMGQQPVLDSRFVEKGWDKSTQHISISILETLLQSKQVLFIFHDIVREALAMSLSGFLLELKKQREFYRPLQRKNLGWV